MQKTVRSVFICINHLPVTHNTANTRNRAVNVTLFVIMYAVQRNFANARTVYNKRVARRQAYTFRLWLLVRINQFISFTENAHCLFKFRVQTRHILNGKTIFNRLNIVSVRTAVRHRIAYKIAFCNIHDILRVIAHNFVVRDIVAWTSAFTNCVFADIIVVKFFVSLLFKRMFPNQLSKQHLVYTVL